MDNEGLELGNGDVIVQKVRIGGIGEIGRGILYGENWKLGEDGTHRYIHAESSRAVRCSYAMISTSVPYCTQN